MAVLDDARAQFPNLAPLPDTALAAELHRQFYSDIPLADFYERIGFDWRAAEAKENLAADPARPVPQGGDIAQRSAFLPVGRTAEGDLTLAVPGVLHDPAAVTGQVIEGNIGIGNVTGEDIANIAPAAGGPGVVNRLLSRGAKAAETAAAASAAPKAVSDEMAELTKLADEADAAFAEPPQARLASNVIDIATRESIEARRPPDRAGNINLDRIWAPEDVKSAIKQTAADNADFFAARRGKITHEETRDMAQMLGMSADVLAQRQRGKAFNAEEMFAARELLVSQATKVRDLARRADRGSEAEKAQFAEEVTRLVSIQEQVSGATAEAGRALSQFRMLAGATKDEISRIVEASKLSGIDDMARKIAELDDPAKVAAFARNAYKAKTSDMLFEAWVNGVLSGPQTHAANLLSNALVSAWAIPESATAAALSKLTGSGISAREPFARAVGGMEGIKEGLVAAWKAYRTEMPSDGATKIEARAHQAIPNFPGTEIGGKQIRIPGRLLMAEDEFFKAIGYRQEIGALATRQAVNEGLGGRKLAERIAELKASPTDEMQAAASKAAQKQTFTNPLGDAGNAIMLLRDRGGIAMKAVAPFVRTPINLIKFAADRNFPFAFLFQEARDNIMGRNGPIARDNQIARIGLGTAVSAATAYMVAEGHITGGGPSRNEGDKRALMRAAGWQPYSVKIGDTHYSYSRLEPMGMLMGVAADFVELQDALSKEDKKNVAALIVGSVSRNLISKTWLKGPSELNEAVMDPERYGPRYIQQLAGSVIPAGIAQYTRVSDPFLREARTILDSIKSRTPGYSEDLFTRRDPFGEPIKREGSLGPDMISPIYQTAAKSDPTIAEMVRLKVYPGNLDRKIRGAELTDAEYDAYSQTSGQLMKTALDTLVGLPEWRNFPEAVQVDAMQDIIRKARDKARTMTIAQHPDLPLRIVAETIRRKRLDR